MCKMTGNIKLVSQPGVLTLSYTFNHFYDIHMSFISKKMIIWLSTLPSIILPEWAMNENNEVAFDHDVQVPFWHVGHHCHAEASEIVTLGFVCC